MAKYFIKCREMGYVLNIEKNEHNEVVCASVIKDKNNATDFGSMDAAEKVCKELNDFEFSRIGDKNGESYSVDMV